MKESTYLKKVDAIRKNASLTPTAVKKIQNNGVLTRNMPTKGFLSKRNMPTKGLLQPSRNTKLKNN